MRGANRNYQGGAPLSLVSNQKKGSRGTQSKPASRGSRGRNTASQSSFLDVRGCQTIKDLIQTASSHDNLSPRVCSVFWSLAPHLLTSPTQGHTCTELQSAECSRSKLTTILNITVDKVDELFPRQVCATVLGMAKVAKHLRGARRNRRTEYYWTVFRDLLATGNDVFRSFAIASTRLLPSFDARCLSNLAYAHALVKYLPVLDDGSTLFDRIAENAIARLQSFNPHDLANLVWAYSKQGAAHSQLFAAVANSVIGRDLKTFKTQEISNIVWAFASAGESSSRMFTDVAQFVSKSCFASFAPQGLSNTLWAYAKAGEANRSLFKAAEDHLVKRDLAQFKPQALSNIVWAYAKAGESSSRLFKKFAEEIVKRDLATFRPQHLSNIVWAYATAGESSSLLFNRVTEEIVKRDLAQFIPQQLSNIIWAYATAGESSTQLFKKFAEEIVKRDLATFRPQHLSNIVWAYAKAGVSRSWLFKKVAEEIGTRDLTSFKAQDFSNIVWAYATSGESSSALFDSIASAAIARSHELNAQDVSNLLWAFASTDRVKQQRFQAFTPTVTAIIEQCTAQNLANIAWTYAVSNVSAPVLFGDRFIAALLKKEFEFNVNELSQLHQWQLWQLELESNASLPPALLVRCREAFQSSGVQSSNFQDDVVRELSGLGLQLKEEYLLSSGYTLDALVKVNGENVGVEVDGPYHFIGKMPTGSTTLKRRQAASIDGIHLVSVPYWEWRELGNSRSRKQAYLKAKLNQRAAASTARNCSSGRLLCNPSNMNAEAVEFIPSFVGKSTRSLNANAIEFIPSWH